MSKIKKNFELLGLEVVDTSTEGKAIARHENLVVFIEGAVPGAKSWVVRITKAMKKANAKKPKAAAK